MQRERKRTNQWKDVRRRGRKQGSRVEHVKDYPRLTLAPEITAYRSKIRALAQGKETVPRFHFERHSISIRTWQAALCSDKCLYYAMVLLLRDKYLIG